MRAEARAEASKARPMGPAGDDAIDNELLVKALAQDMLGERAGADQIAETYAKHARSLLDA